MAGAGPREYPAERFGAGLPGEAAPPPDIRIIPEEPSFTNSDLSKTATTDFALSRSTVVLGFVGGRGLADREAAVVAHGQPLHPAGGVGREPAG